MAIFYAIYEGYNSGMKAYNGVKNNEAPIPPNDLAIIDKIIKLLTPSI